MTSAGQECHICLEELRRSLAAAPCGHVFHHHCVLQALQVHAQCPICRRSVRDRDLVSLYFDVPSGGEPPSAAEPAATTSSAQSPETQKLSLRVNALMERVQWEKRQKEALLGERARLRDVNEALQRDQQALAHRAAALEHAKLELLGKVAKYQAELTRQHEQARRAAVNQSLARFLDTCDGDAIEDEIQNPRELIAALKKACKFRHEQYQKVVKDKMRLKAMLQQAAGGGQSGQGGQGGKAKLRAPLGAPYESKRPSNAVEYPVESKKRRIEAAYAQAASPVPFATAGSMATMAAAPPAAYSQRAEAASYRANAYSDVSVRPVSAPRATLGRSSYNQSHYGAFQLTPASSLPEATSAPLVCRRGYDETGKLTNFFLPKQPPGSAAMPARGGGGGGMMAPPTAVSAGASLLHAATRKAVPSMRSLLNEEEYAPMLASPGLGDARSSGDRREYTLTNWLRKT